MRMLAGGAFRPVFELYDRASVIPPVGAFAPIVTVPVELTPPTTLFGLMAIAVSAGGVRVKVAVFVAPASVAVKVTGVDDATTLDVAVNVA
jgi:hypothetical protein